MSNDQLLNSSSIHNFRRYYRRISRTQLFLLGIVIILGFSLLLYASMISYHDTWTEHSGGGLFSIGAMIVLLLSYGIKKLEQRLNLLQTFDEYEALAKMRLEQHKSKEQMRKERRIQKHRKRMTKIQEKEKRQRESLHALIKDAKINDTP